MKVRFADRVVYVLARAAIGVAARVPQWFGYGAAAALGRLFFLCDRRRRGYALRFLKNAFPGRSDRDLLRIGFVATGNLFKVPLDMARLSRLLARGGDIGEVLDYGKAQPLLAMKPPFLGLSGHLGSWEVAGIAVAQRSGGAHAVARISKNPLLEQWILSNRERGGVHIHPRRGGVRPLASALAAGSVGLLAVDQNQRLRGVFAPFFGENASCERAAASLALRHGYPIIIGTALRLGSGFRFEFVALEPFVLQRTGDKEGDLRAAVIRINQAIEQLVRLAPEQYLWIHDRYRTQPPVGQAAAGASASEDAGASEAD